MRIGNHWFLVDVTKRDFHTHKQCYIAGASGNGAKQLGREEAMSTKTLDGILQGVKFENE